MDELPIVCDLGSLTGVELERQRELWSSVFAASRERKALHEGFSFRLPAERLRETAELMAMERRCCAFLKLTLEADAAEPDIWFSLSGPSGTKALLEQELERFSDQQAQRNP